MENTLKLRHFVVHGFFADGSFINHRETGKEYDFISMERSCRSDAPEREIVAFTKNALEWLAQEFWGRRRVGGIPFEGAVY